MIFFLLGMNQILPTSANSTHMNMIQVPEFETIELKNETEDFDVKEQEPHYPLHFDNMETNDINEVLNIFLFIIMLLGHEGYFHNLI